MTRYIVRDLVAKGVLRVEDGNHGNDRPRPDEFIEQGVAFIRAADMTSGVVDFVGAGKINHVARQRIRKGIGAGGDVILSHKGTVGRVAVTPIGSPEFVCSPQTTFWRSLDYDVIDQRYLAYALRSEDFKNQLAAFAGQTDMAPYVSLTDQRSITIELPAIETQRRISGLLGSLDDKIAANRVVEHFSVDLIESLYSRAVSGAEVVVRPLFEVMDVDFGEAFKGEFFSEPGVGRPLIRIRDLKTFRPQTWTTESRPKEIMISPGDVVVGMDAEFRAEWWMGAPGLLNQRVCRVRGIDGGPALVACALREPLNALESEKSATTVIHLNKADLARSVVRVPTGATLREFEAAAEPLVQSRVQLALEDAHLAIVRDQLLPLLMSERISVRGAETVVEGVA